MGEDFQGGVCGGTWWNPSLSLFSAGGASGLSSPCSVAQLGSGYDMGNFGWPNEVIKGKSSVHTFEKNDSLCDNSMINFPAEFDSTLDILGFGLSPTTSTTDWNQQNLHCHNGTIEGGYNSILPDDVNSRICYAMTANNLSSSAMINNDSNFSINNSSCNQDGSPPMALTTSSNSSGDSSSITSEGGVNTSFPMSSSASYLIQTLFDDTDESQVLGTPQSMAQPINPSYGSVHSVQAELDTMLGGGMNLAVNGLNDNMNTLNNIKASLLNSLQSRSRASNSLNPKSHTCSNKLSTKAKNEDTGDSKSNVDQPPAKRPRIETPSSLPTFKVRKEKLGDRITALQQLVSPFGKTDTASVLHEAIEYVKFLHDQVRVLSTPYLKNGAPVQQQQVPSTMKDNEESKQDLRSRGLCLVPISSTYPVAQETPVDFWTPTFGGIAFG